MIKVIVLINGLELIADVEQAGDCEKTPALILKNPRRIIPTPEGIAITGASMLGENSKITITPLNVLFQDSPREEIRNLYAEHTNSIITSNSSLNYPKLI